MTELSTLKKAPLQWAASFATTLAQQIEEGADLDQALIEEFKGAEVSIAEAIDRRKALVSYCDMMIDRCKAAKNECGDQQKKFERIKERVKEDTKKVIEENPGVPYVDSIGRKVQVVNNGTPKLKLNLPLTGSKNVGHILDQTTIEMFVINPKYIKKVSFLTLDVELLKNDLRDGFNCDWAELEFNKQLRGL